MWRIWRRGTQIGPRGTPKCLGYAEPGERRDPMTPTHATHASSRSWIRAFGALFLLALVVSNAGCRSSPVAIAAVGGDTVKAISLISIQNSYI